MDHTHWQGKPYYSLDAYCKDTFGHKCYKIALNAHMTCPNRDGSLDTRGCVFCSKGGSGDFAVPLTLSGSITPQLEEGLSLFREKQVGTHFIAYFQAYTNTYAPLPYLEAVYRQALDHPMVCGISIATRPDCMGEEILALLKALAGEYPEKFIWIELGLQTIHPATAAYIRRGYPLKVFEETFYRLKQAGFPVIVHVIIGLPGETPEMLLATIRYLNGLLPFGIKLQLLHVLEGTDLALDYRAGQFQVLSKEEYLELVTECIAVLSPQIVIHRLTGDGKGEDLIAPLWSRGKRDVLNSLHKKLKEEKITQGAAFSLLSEKEALCYRIR